jgi:hypothetical protein
MTGFEGFTDDALEFYDGLMADNSKTYRPDPPTPGFSCRRGCCRLARVAACAQRGIPCRHGKPVTQPRHDARTTHSVWGVRPVGCELRVKRQPGFELCGVSWTADVVSLSDVAASLDEASEGVGGFDPFGDDFHVE